MTFQQARLKTVGIVVIDVQCNSVCNNFVRTQTQYIHKTNNVYNLWKHYKLIAIYT